MKDDLTVLFVCTGNICRSPMAEYLLRDRLDSDAQWRVVSAGVLATVGRPASPAAVEALREHGIDMSAHRSRPVTEELVDRAQLIVVMTIAQKVDMMDRFPSARGKVYLLKSFDLSARDGDVEDPIGLPLEAYRRVRDKIDAALPDLLVFLYENWGIRRRANERGDRS
ncbi:MAG: low molecular weight protein arginine phosphatase [Kiritimatiellae bacterium]|nr:low molecular weight protein arginine phosphatase [Kiritimatiellia bacterium]